MISREDLQKSIYRLDSNLYQILENEQGIQQRTEEITIRSNKIENWKKYNAYESYFAGDSLITVQSDTPSEVITYHYKYNRLETVVTSQELLGGSKRVSQFTYAPEGRLVNLTTVDYSTGLELTYEPNTTDLIGVSKRTGPDTLVSYFQYDSDSVFTEHLRENGQLFEIREHRKADSRTITKSFNPEKQLLWERGVKYNQKGEPTDIWLTYTQTYRNRGNDVGRGFRTSISYDQDGNESERKTTYH